MPVRLGLLMVIARFRADPAKVRVRVQRVANEWFVTAVSRKHDAFMVNNSHPDAGLAVLHALHRAERAGMEGIDPDMDRAYDHPMYESAYERTGREQGYDPPPETLRPLPFLRGM